MTKQQFLAELKLQYEKEFERKNSLESKSNYLVTVNGIVIPILFTIGIFILEKINEHYVFLGIIKFMLVLVVILNIVSITLSVIGYAVKNYRYAFRGENFNLENGDINLKELDAYNKFTNEEMEDKLIRVYIKCNYENRKQTDFKGLVILFSQIVFLISFIFIPIILSILFYSPIIINK